jgi:PAS domain S-box-containing protein
MLGWVETSVPVECADLNPSVANAFLSVLAGERVGDIEIRAPAGTVTGNVRLLIGADGAKVGGVLTLNYYSGPGKLEGMQAHLTNVLDMIGDAFMAFDHLWRYVYLNTKAAELTGRSQEEMLGKNVWEEYPEAVKELFYTELHRAVAENKSVHFENYYAPLNKWFENDAHPWPGGVAVFYRDITERKRIESDLARKAEELTRSNADLQQFTSAVSHDLQEPLRTVNIYTQLLARRFSGQFGQGANELISEITKSSVRMRDMIRDLLVFSRVAQDENDWFGPVDFEEVLAWAVENLRIAIAESGASITHDPLPVVPAIELQMRQLFQNLIGNAIKYRGAEPVRIHVSANKGWGEWLISFRDNGIGIEPSQWERIFELFRRGAATDQYEGTGVGLALCRRIAQRHGGSLRVESQQGQGSTFYLILPGSLTDSSF